MASLRVRRTVLNLFVATQLATVWAAGLPARGAEEKPRPRIDLAFCIDTTGSMGNEIENVKARTKELVAKIAGGKPTPVIRVGLVAYRDKGDEYVTKTFPFTSDIDKMVKDVSTLSANGGGDTPEAVNEALHVAVNNLKWSDDKKTLKLLFLIGDAGPHANDREFNWKTEARAAIAKGIQINTLGCGSLESDAASTDVFKEIAHLADGKYEALAYRTEVADGTGHKVTMVASGGKVYKLKRGATADAWRGGARALEAVADVVPAAPSMVAARGAMMAKPMMAGMAMPAGMSYAAPAAAGALDRRENNLADVVLQATRDAARKKLDVNFKEK